jgi:hypothetical protein
MKVVTLFELYWKMFVPISQCWNPGVRGCHDDEHLDQEFVGFDPACFVRYVSMFRMYLLTPSPEQKYFSWGKLLLTQFLDILEICQIKPFL